jgi:hypothetical protein
MSQDTDAAVDAAVTAVERGVDVSQRNEGVLFLPAAGDLQGMEDLLAEHDGSEKRHLVAELRAQLRKQMEES